jgi:diguanylate cyclase
MALEYKTNIGIETIVPILDEHIVWYGKMMRVFFERSTDVPPIPTVFDEWVGGAERDHALSEGITQRLRRLHADMVKAGTVFIAKAMMWDQNPLDEFNEFTRHYEEFIQFMRYVEREQALDNSGIDDRTGLRSTKVMLDDINREMHRRSRRGNPFALALLRINDYSDQWAEEEESFMLTIRKIADQIRYTLRSFDDAYYLGGAYFLVSLKHADGVGSQVAASRLSSGVASAHIAQPQSPGKEISIVALVSDPVEGQDIVTLIEHMKLDMGGVAAGGTVLQYNDLSPLQRMAKNSISSNS